MFRVAWWLVLAFAVHNALWCVGLGFDNEIAGRLVFYGVLYGVVLTGARCHLGEPWTEFAPRRGMSLGLVIPVAMATAGGLLLNHQSIRVCELMNLLSPEALGLPFDGSSGAAPSYEPPLVESLVATALLPAVCEEALNRGLVLTALAATMSKRRAIFISALYFAAMHMSLERMPDTFAMGIFYGWLFVRTGSLLPGMLAHFLHNSFCVLFPTADSVPGVPAEWLAVDRYGLLSAGTVWAGIALIAASAWVIRMSVRREREGAGTPPTPPVPPVLAPQAR